MLIQQQRSNTTGAVINNNINASQFGVSNMKNSITQQALTQQIPGRPYELMQQQQQQLQQHQLQQQAQQTFSGLKTFMKLVKLS